MPPNQLNKEVHIWSVTPETVQEPHILEKCLSTLSETELQQYRRFRFPEDSHSYLVSHALVRHALSKYADIPPSEWVFQKNSNGRPEISNPGITPICFNLTHTAGYAACVISLEGRCGIDAERTTSRHNLVAVAKKMFSPAEYQTVQALRGEEQRNYFFSRWTLREAYVKALGIGISFPTRKLSFEMNSDEDIRIAFEEGIKDAPDNWRFQLFNPTESHIAAIALGGKQQKNRKILRQSLKFD